MNKSVQLSANGLFIWKLAGQKERQFRKTGRKKFPKLKFVSAQEAKMMKKPVEFSAIWLLLELFPGQEKNRFHKKLL